MRNKILNIIYSSLQYLNESRDKEGFNILSEDTKLYPENLSSIELVMLLADIELSLFESINKDIILADGKAMSMTNSPFNSVKSLANYIENLCN
jgi:hypothetical protein